MTDEDINKSWDNIAHTPDGAVIYAHFQKIAIGIRAGADPSDSALRADHGRRSVAHEIMGLMAKGIEESGGRTSSDGTSGGKPSERPLVFRVREPAAISRVESSREWARRSAGTERGTDD